MKTRFVATLSILSTLSTLAAPLAANADVGYANYQKDGKWLAANVSVLEKDGKQIVLIPMVHISTRKFYMGVRKELDQFASKNAVILQEGVSVCGPEGDSSHLAWVPSEAFDATKAEAVLAAAKESGTPPSAEALEDAGFVQEDCAVVEGGKASKWEKFKHEWLSTYSLIGMIFALRSQTNIHGLYPKEVARKDGDVIGAHLKSTTDQMVFNSMVDCFEAFVGTGGTGRCGKVVSWLKSSPNTDTNGIIVKLRNQVLMAKLNKALGLEVDAEAAARYEITDAEIGKTHDVVILPWGADHFAQNDAEFPRTIEAAGFELSRVGDIKISRCSRVRRNMLLRGTSSNVCTAN